MMSLKDLASELEACSRLPAGDIRYEKAWDALSLGMMLLSIEREIERERTLERGQALEQKQERERKANG